MLRSSRCVVAVATVVAVLLGGMAVAGAQEPPPHGDTIVAPGVLETAEADGVARVVVALAAPFRPEGVLSGAAVEAQQDGIADAQAGLVEAVGPEDGEVVRQLSSLPYAALELTPEGIEALAASGTVISIGLDGVARPELNSSVPVVDAAEAWTAGFDGTGQVVSIIDTGVDADHPFLDVIEEACFVDDNGVPGGTTGGCPNGETTQTGPGAAAPCEFTVGQCQHGTHVAGIAASHDATFAGVARDAEVLAIQIMHETGGGPIAWFSDIAAGLEHTLSRQQDVLFLPEIAAANLSLSDGTPVAGACDSFPSDPSRQSVVDAIANLVSEDIAVVAAAGNQGSSTGLPFPACTTDAIAVGNTFDFDVVNGGSNSSKRLDLWAPGSSVTSSFPGGGTGTITGTSMSAPHVAGALAILHEEDPGASLDVLRRRLQISGICIKDTRNQLRFHRLDVDDAMNVEIPLHPFTDIPACAWEEVATSWAAFHAIVSGFPDGTFLSSSSLNRGQAVAWLWHLLDEPPSITPHGFADVPSGAWYEAALDWAKEDGVVTGFTDGTYRPKDPVTRGQIVQWLWHALREPPGTMPHGFTDVPAGAWNELALNWAAEHGIVTGFADGTYRPNDPVTRAQITVMLHRLANSETAWSAWSPDPYPSTVLFP